MNTPTLYLAIILSISTNAFNQSIENYTLETTIPVTNVKNQYRTSACWSFSVLSMLESEILQRTNDTVDLSEMFIVRNAYIDKARTYVRMHGKIKFSGGGALNDAIDIIKDHGILPEEAYSGLKVGEKNHNHHEMEEGLIGFVDSVIENEEEKLSPVWHDGFTNLIDTYLGNIPNMFDYNGKTYTAKSFMEYLKIDPENYILLTSFTHHPFYEKFVLEVPDNWSWGMVYNLPLDEFMATIDYSLANGYSFAWATDISEYGFSSREGIAEITSTDWEDIAVSFEEFDIDNKVITQEIRQVAFDNYQTQDDHGLHVYGIARDTTGCKFYIAKNSWGTQLCGNDGHIYVSEQYIRYKTISIIVNKNGIPKDILNKLNLK